ncbi:MAG: Ferrochelatase, protoheme ferro-lyase [uncultured Acetobacteraceae bacterium]|jgi:ferrochelatase|uniref:Ferrochelatase n=1 Tax=uncultured Acetobacteraceae bacterium TaxID=169975 RepID=A0A6J4JW97_9PROT|nr:MAG: Ferrochelatase, protoheme ferro-lyase [uncultured Acetobacteraceae bacterium]
MRRVAVVLFNLGGPDAPEAVRPFLENLFTDPAILRVPNFVRPWLGRFIAGRRTKAATENYAILGGRSPLRELTEAQGQALEAALNAPGTAEEGEEHRCFVAMRYWHPFSEEAARAVRDWGATEVVLLPLYPQFSTTTTGSSMAAWDEAARAIGLRLPTTTLCCWHSDEGFAAATAALVREARDKALAELPLGTGLRVLFSAHGLPESIVKRGDPYQWQVERTVAAVVEALGVADLDHQVCYQSRVTPQRWIGPSLEDALETAAEDKVAALVCPIAFVSEHSETLVELDVEYREVAHNLGVPGYFRVPTQNSDGAFIASLAALVRRARDSGRELCSFAGARQCPRVHGDCPHAKAGAGKGPATRGGKAPAKVREAA